MICVDLFDKNELKGAGANSYRDIITHIIEGMNYSFGIKPFEDFSNFGYIFPEIKKHPELYLQKNNIEELLIKLKKKQKKLFFATNSNYSYSNFILEKIIGSDYDKYFDLCFYKSSKPSFFEEGKITNSKCFFLDETFFSCEYINEEEIDRIKSGNENKKLSGGSYYLVEKYYEKVLNKNKKEIKYLFVGDNILSDCKAHSKIESWSSIFIYDDINLKYVEDSDNEDNNNNNCFSAILAPYFEDGDCQLVLPNVNGLNYLIL